MTTPCQLTTIDRRAHNIHVFHCADTRCRDYGIALLKAAIGFMELGAGVDIAALEPEGKDTPCDAS